MKTPNSPYHPLLDNNMNICIVRLSHPLPYDTPNVEVFHFFCKPDFQSLTMFAILNMIHHSHFQTLRSHQRPLFAALPQNCPSPDFPSNIFISLEYHTLMNVTHRVGQNSPRCTCTIDTATLPEGLQKNSSNFCKNSEVP